MMTNSGQSGHRQGISLNDAPRQRALHANAFDRYGADGADQTQATASYRNPYAYTRHKESSAPHAPCAPSLLRSAE